MFSILLVTRQAASQSPVAAELTKALSLIGQTTAAARASGVPCEFTAPEYYGRYAHCTYTPANPVLKRIQLSALDGRVVQMNIWPGADYVRLGSIEAVWGQPMVRGIMPDGTYSLVWPHVGAETRVDSTNGFLSPYAIVVVLDVDGDSAAPNATATQVQR